MYNEIIMNNFNNPLNDGELKGANGIGKEKSKKYGDIIKFFVKVDENKKIEEVTFKSTGCVATIAISSALTAKMTGMSIDRVSKIDVDQINNLVGGLPEIKMYCAVLAKEAIANTVANYKKRMAKQA